MTELHIPVNKLCIGSEICTVKSSYTRHGIFTKGVRGGAEKLAYKLTFKPFQTISNLCPAVFRAE
jgi:hypothetical protein